MADIPSSRQKITVEQTSYRAAVSESLMQDIGGSINWIIDNSAFQLGDIIASGLTEAQFQAQKGTGWVLMQGQNIAGSDFEALTGIQDLPDMVGNAGHLEQLETGNSMFDFFPNENKLHNHNQGSFNRLLQVTGSFTTGGVDTTPGEPDIVNTGVIQNNGGAKARPNSYQINYFILINN
jgi:hypothetical protein